MSNRFFCLEELFVAQIEQDLTEALLRVRMVDGQIDESDAEQDGQQQAAICAVWPARSAVAGSSDVCRNDSVATSGRNRNVNASVRMIPEQNVLEFKLILKYLRWDLCRSVLLCLSTVPKMPKVPCDFCQKCQNYRWHFWHFWHFWQWRPP